MRTPLYLGLLSFSFGLALQAEAGSATWKADPHLMGWNNPADWMPATVPNGASDIAMFAQSTMTNVSISAATEVSQIDFTSVADAFSINVIPAVALTISGAGVTNGSGAVQNLVVMQNNSSAGQLFFKGAATAGDSVTYTNQTSLSGAQNPLIQFQDSATAGSAQLLNNAADYSSVAGIIEFQGNSTAADATIRNTGTGDQQSPTVNFRNQASAGQAVISNEAKAEGLIVFRDTSTADHATVLNFQGGCDFEDQSSAGDAVVTNYGGVSGSTGGATFFEGTATAANSTFVVNGGMSDTYGGAAVVFSETSTAGSGTFAVNGAEFAGDLAFPGIVEIQNNSSADHGIFYANGGKVAGAKGGIVYLDNFATGGAGTFYANGGTVDGALGGRVNFSIQRPTAAAATLIATGGVGSGEGAGGGLLFQEQASGGTARVEVFGNGFLDLRALGLQRLGVGSLEGDGLVFLGAKNLSIGSNNLSTTFSGTLEGDPGSSVTKLGTGTLTYNGSSTFPGLATVAAGTLGGNGTLTGALSIGTGSGAGAVLAPAAGGPTPMTLTTQSSLTFQDDGSYTCTLSTKKLQGDKVAALGVTIEPGAVFKLQTLAKKRLAAGQNFVVLNNTAATPIIGRFSNLADGATLKSGNNKFQASYEGGDGNDLTLTVQ